MMCRPHCGKNNVYHFPKEKVASLHRLAHGAEPNVLAQEHTVSWGTDVTVCSCQLRCLPFPSKTLSVSGEIAPSCTAFTHEHTDSRRFDVEDPVKSYRVQSSAGSGARVFISECDPFCALQAYVDSSR